MANKSSLKPFKKGDKRINRKGRPKDFPGLRELAQQIAHEAILQKDGSERTLTELIIRKWAVSNDPRLQIEFMQIAFGKVPTPIEQKNSGEVVLRVVYGDDGTDSKSS